MEKYKEILESIRELNDRLDVIEEEILTMHGDLASFYGMYCESTLGRKREAENLATTGLTLSSVRLKKIQPRIDGLRKNIHGSKHSEAMKTVDALLALLDLIDDTGKEDQ